MKAPFASEAESWHHGQAHRRRDIGRVYGDEQENARAEQDRAEHLPLASGGPRLRGLIGADRSGGLLVEEA